MDYHRIVLPSYIMMGEPQIEQLLLKFNEAYTSSFEKILLDFSNLKFINGELTVLIAAFVRYLQYVKKEVFIDDDSVPRIHRNLFERNGLFQEFGLSKKTEDLNNTTIQIKTFNPNKSEDISKYIEDILIQKISEVSFSDSVANSLEKISPAIFELVDNINTHVQSPLVIFAGQYYPKKNRITFAIADIGKSIPFIIKSAGKVNYDNDFDFIDWATKQGTTTKLELLNQTPGGLGLFVVKEIMSSQGELAILSNKGFWKLHQSDNIPKVTKKDFTVPFPGTAIQVTFLLNNKSTETKSFNSLGDNSFLF